MGDWEARALALVESPLGYHPSGIEILTGCHESGAWTVLGGQFDWGGRLRKSNGGVQRFPHDGWKPSIECKGIRELNCNTYKWSRYESRT